MSENIVPSAEELSYTTPPALRETEKAILEHVAKLDPNALEVTSGQGSIDRDGKHIIVTHLRQRSPGLLVTLEIEAGNADNWMVWITHI